MKKIIFTLFFLAFLPQCLEKKSDIKKKAQLGEEVSAEKINQVKKKYLSLLSAAHLKLGDYAVYESNLKIDTQSPQVVQLESQELIKKEKISEEILQLTIQNVKIDLTQKEPTKVVTESLFQVNNEPEESQNIFSTFSKNILTPEFRPYQENYTSQKFYNLKVRDSFLPEPQRVIDENRCLSTETCKVKVTEILYDHVLFTDSGASKKFKVKIGISNDTHYLAQIYYLCQVEVANLKSDSFLVSRCSTLSDYFINP